MLGILLALLFLLATPSSVRGDTIVPTDKLYAPAGGVTTPVVSLCDVEPSDCGAAVLQMQYQLLVDGYPLSMLLLTVIENMEGKTRLALMVRSKERGDLILEPGIFFDRHWFELPSCLLKPGILVKRQCPNCGVGEWVSLRQGVPKPPPVIN
jgi:hypothetical protein